MRKNIGMFFLLCLICASATNCNAVASSEIDDSQIALSSDSHDSSIDDFDFDFDYIEYDFRKIRPFIESKNYNISLSLLDEHGMSPIITYYSWCGFSYKGYNIYFKYDTFKSGYESITYYKIVPKTYLTLDRANKLGFFGTTKTRNFDLYYNFHSNYSSYVKSTETYWESKYNYELNIEFFESLDMWDSTMFMFNLGEGHFFSSGVYYESISAIPIFSNDLTEIAGVVFFDKTGKAHTYMSSNRYDKFITSQNYIEQFVDAAHYNDSFGRARFYFNKGSYINGEYPRLNEYKGDFNKFRNRINDYYSDTYGD